MNKFKVGDTVRRIKGDWGSFKIGDIGVITEIPRPCDIKVDSVDFYMSPRNLELVEDAKIKELEARITELEAELKSVKSQQVPCHGQVYWFVTPTFTPSGTKFDQHCPVHRSRLEVYNYFQTEKEAQEVADKFKEILSERA